MAKYDIHEKSDAIHTMNDLHLKPYNNREWS